MNPRELVEEHTAFLGVYRARISRAKQVKKTFVEMLCPLAVEHARAEKAINDLESEYENADDVIEQYEAQLKTTTRILAELERGGGITGSGEGTRPRKKKPGRLGKLLRLQRKLTALLEDDPELVELLEEDE